MILTVDSTQLVLVKIKELQDAVMANQADVSFNKNLQLIIGIIIVLITIGGQLVIFRLTKKKELELFKINREKELELFRINRQKDITTKIAELYSKHKSSAANYALDFFTYNDSQKEHKVFDLIVKNYKEITPEQKADFTADQLDVLQQTIEVYEKLRNKAAEKCSLHLNIYRKQRIESNELLQQIYFFYQDKELSDLINQYNAIKLHTFDNLEYTSEMLQRNYFSTYSDKNILPLSMKIQDISHKISSRILTISKNNEAKLYK